MTMRQLVTRQRSSFSLHCLEIKLGRVMSANQMKILWGLTLVALLVMVLYLGNHLRALMSVDQSVVPGCVIENGHCTVALDTGLSIRMSVSPWPVLALQPVQFEVLAEDLQLKAASLALTGRNMYMGIHQYSFQPSPDQKSLRVTGTISVCTERVMPWRGRVELETTQGKRQLWFDFDVIQL